MLTLIKATQPLQVFTSSDDRPIEKHVFNDKTATINPETSHQTRRFFIYLWHSWSWKYVKMFTFWRGKHNPRGIRWASVTPL